MKKIIIGFDSRKISDAILNELRRNGHDDIQVFYKNSKIAVRDALLKESGNSTLLLMEQCGLEKWTVSEIAQLRDMATVHIIPILYEDTATAENMQLLYNYGITDAVIMDKKKGLRVNDVAKLIFNPRNLKAARVYYHISTVADSTCDISSTLTDEQMEELKAALNDTTFGGENSTYGIRYKQLALSLNVEQNMYFISHIDGPTLVKLQQTKEFYDVCDILVQNGAQLTYTRPKELGQPVSDEYRQSVVIDTPVNQKESAEAGQYENKQVPDSEDVTQEEEPVITDHFHDDDLGFQSESVDQAALNEQIVSLSKENEKVEDEVQRMLEEEELRDAEEELINKKSRVIAYVAFGVAFIIVCLIVSFITITIKRGKEQEARKASLVQDYNVTYEAEEGDGESVEFKELGMEEAEESTDDEDAINPAGSSSEDVSENGIGMEEDSISDGGEIKLVIADNPEQTQETPQNMTTYIAEGGEETTGQAVEDEESGNTQSNGNTSTVKNSITNKTIETLTERGTSVVNSVQNALSTTKNSNSETSESQIATVPSYTYRPTALSSEYTNIGSKLKQDAKVTGLEIINFVNSENGQDCTVTLKDGTVINIRAQNAGIGDVVTGAEYIVDNSGKMLNFIEQ